MRILDQWGISDIPYEQVCITIDDGNVIGYISAVAGNNLRILLAEYSDTQVAKKAAKMMRIAYQRYKTTDTLKSMLGESNQYFQFPPEENL